jgi:hypothetical protein
LTDPVEIYPPVRLGGLNVTDWRVDGPTVTVSVRVTPPTAAAIVEDTWLVTAMDLMVNVAVEEPAGTETLPGTVTIGLLLVS